jgi:hydroxymethylglutaryl-CoA reductase
MRMHLLNILVHLQATDIEKNKAVDHFKHIPVSFSSVREFLESIRSK